MIDYLAIGHITHDLAVDGYTIGGTVAYSGRTAQALGCRTAVLTSAGPDCDVQEALPDVAVESVPAAETTTFENVYLPAGRRQVVHSVAAPLTAEAVPREWQRASIVHLGPVAGEVDPELVNGFGTALICITPQGWLREWDAMGNVTPRSWPQARQILPRAAAVVLSMEDLPNAAMLQQFRRWSRLLVLTEGVDGCTVFLAEEQRHFPAPGAVEVNPTGAGDIFAAAFFIRLYQTKGNPWEAARFANEIAARSVEQPDLPAKILSLEAVEE
ncbi:MAG TPA: PfkB family carbohydrate kinase [Candidatus Sulfomarinibacteraceae bacterium]|nr:PfkB family carbohydrate kinase [Candidatus Sulfomarinibacteraceae bacterium]